MKNWLKLVLCIIGVELVGILSSFLSLGSLDIWYSSLIRPSFNPPSWIFGPVWTILYAMIGASLYFFMMSKGKKKDKKTAYWIFGIQILLNFIWSPIFFGMHNIFLAVIVIALLWLAIIFTFLAFYKISKTSAWLLVPYWFWVSFASILNFSLWMLNR